MSEMYEKMLLRSIELEIKKRLNLIPRCHLSVEEQYGRTAELLEMMKIVRSIREEYD